MQLIFLLPMSFILALNACKKPSEKEEPYYHMDEEFKKTFLQGWEGSYWIYTDSLGSTHDTVILVTANKGIGNIEDDYEAEEYSTHYEATNCRDYFTTLTTARAVFAGKTEAETYYIFRMSTNSGVEIHLTLREGKYEPEVRIQKLDSVTLLGKTYYNVVKTGGTSYSKIIIDPEIGIVYKEAWSERPSAGVKKFYLREYQLK